MEGNGIFAIGHEGMDAAEILRRMVIHLNVHGHLSSDIDLIPASYRPDPEYGRQYDDPYLSVNRLR